MEQYSNVLKALQGMQAPSAGGLTYEQQSENYNAFSDLMRKGIYIPDLLKRIDELESEVKALETRPGRDAESFPARREAVKVISLHASRWSTRGPSTRVRD